MERWTGPKLGPGEEAAAATGIPVATIHSADSVALFLRRFVSPGRSGGRPTFRFRRTPRDSRPEFVRTLALETRGLVTQDLLPVRMLNEFQYCPRLSYLEWVQGEWAYRQDGSDRCRR